MCSDKNRFVCASNVFKKPLFLLLRTKMFVVLVLVSLCGCSSGHQEQKFAMEPQDQTAVVGSRVTLPCRVEHKSGQLQWTKDDFGLGLQRDLSGYERYRMIGSDEEGDYSLDIRDVTLDDDAKYQCQVSSGPRGDTAIRSRYARLTVLVPPEPPRILQGKYHSTTEDSEVKLECVAVGGKPPAEITWVDSNAGVLTQGVNYTVEALSDGQRYTARSVITMTPKQEHHNQTFTCQAQNTADRAYRSASILIEVKYAPKVKLVINKKNSKGKIPEGSDVTISCVADANPSNLTYRWFLDEQQVVGNNSTQLVIRNITRDYNEVILKCVVYNAVGKSEETETLEVTYPPSFRSLPRDAEGELDSAVALACGVDGHPPPEVIWLHHEEDQNIRVGRTANLTLHVDTHTAGRYVCQATVEGYPPIEAEANVFIKGPPKILSNRTQFGSPGAAVRLECAALAVPRVDSIVWTFRGQEIDTIHDQEYTFQEDLQPGGIVNSSLIIRDSQARHFGVYRCNVSNEYGSDCVDIVLTPHKTFPLLLVSFATVSAAVMLLITLALLLVLCQRKQRKNKLAQTVKKPDVTVTAEEFFKEDRNSNISDLKLELAHGNGHCEVDYSNTGSDSTLCSNAKLGGGVPLAGTVPLPSLQSKTYQSYRFSNDYSDPAYADCYKPNGYGNGYQTFGHFGHDYTPGSLRVTSPTAGDKLTPNRSVNGSLPRSMDSGSVVQFTQGNNSQTNSLKRALGVKALDSSHDLNSVSSNGDVPRLGNGALSRIDVRYAATYGNPHLRSGTALGFSQVNTAKPASTPAPPPYSSIRSSVVLPSGTSSHSITSRTSVSTPQCATSPLTTSVSTDSTAPQPSAATSIATPASPSGGSAHYVLAPSTRITSNNTIVTKKGNLQSPMATHV